MINVSTFPQTVTIKCDAEDIKLFEATVAALKEAGFEAAGKPMKATGILTAEFWKAPESPIEIPEVEATEDDDQEETLTAEEAAAYNTAKGLEEGQEGYVSEGDPKPADFDEVVNG